MLASDVTADVFVNKFCGTLKVLRYLQSDKFLSRYSTKLIDCKKLPISLNCGQTKYSQ